MPRHDPDEPIFVDSEKPAVAPDGRIYVDRAFCYRAMQKRIRISLVKRVAALVALTLSGIPLFLLLYIISYGENRPTMRTVVSVLLALYLSVMLAIGGAALFYRSLLFHARDGDFTVMTDTVVRVRETWSLAGQGVLDTLAEQVFLIEKINWRFYYREKTLSNRWTARLEYRNRYATPVTTVSFAHAKGFQLYGHDHPISLVNVRDVFLIVSVGRRPLFRRACLWFDTRKYVWKD